MIISTRPRCFLLLPAPARVNPVFSTIMAILGENGIDTWIPEMDDVRIAEIEGFHRADLVIGEITGHDPNVLFELGYATATGKPVLPVMSVRERSVPAALGGRIVLIYDPSQPHDPRLHQILSWWLDSNVRTLHGALSA